MERYKGLIKYNKLIRDGIPEKIEASGAKYKLHVAGDNEYWDKLKEKLSEEVKEFFQDSSAEEAADVLEVIRAIADLKFGGINELEKIREKKAEKVGGFEKRLILDETDDR